ncbi:MAG: MmcQ/YjbR family DNA-binding protein [Steroidobacteraceae bacterium]|jgi:hypothetical protein|nr:MmcQ/YjbR family DNA-binding protein [Steroidobacteraceae bacterium]
MGELGLEDAVRGLCLALPDVEAFVSHGMPNFRRRKGRVFATLALNHHGDGRIALWLNTPPAMQFDLVDAQPKHFFIPQYVGPAGWLGVRLDSALAWRRVSELVRLAYEHSVRHVGAPLPTPVVPGPSRRPTLADVDPMFAPQAQRAVAAMREVCLALPESSEGTQFGKPVWRAGKKVFAQCYAYRDAPVKAAFWVGVARQGLMTMDPRFSIPPYLGPGGWIALDVAAGFDLSELRSLALESYRHYASKRMLAALGVEPGPAFAPSGSPAAAGGAVRRLRASPGRVRPAAKSRAGGRRARPAPRS